MKVTSFAVEVAKLEGKKSEQSIAQISETLRVINYLLRGALYAIVKLLPEPKPKAK